MRNSRTSTGWRHLAVVALLGAIACDVQPEAPVDAAGGMGGNGGAGGIIPDGEGDEGPPVDAEVDSTPPLDMRLPDRSVPTDAAPVDMTADAGSDAAPDVAMDAAPDLATVDAVIDMSIDAVVDAQVDAVVDAQVDAVVDAEVDAVVDAEVDAVVDAAPPPEVVPVQQLADDVDIIAALRDDGRFPSFVFLLEQTGLAQPLIGRPAITLFAPTDEAIGTFEDANDNVLNVRWVANPDVLRRVMLYHIVPIGDFSVDDLLMFAGDGTTLPTQHPAGDEVVEFSRVPMEPVDGLRVSGAAGSRISGSLDGAGFVIYVLEDGLLVPQELAGDLAP